jgi:hypothetical protein
MDSRSDKVSEGQIGGWVDGRTDGQMDRWAGSERDGGIFDILSDARGCLNGYFNFVYPSTAEVMFR